MGHTNGVDAAKALRILSRVDPAWTRVKIAAEVGCHPRTVARWEAGQHQPRERNRAALQRIVDTLLAYETAGPVETWRARRLQWAREALTTDRQCARNEELATRIAADLAAAEQRRLAEQQQRYATVRQLAAAHRARQEAANVAAVAAADRLVPQQRSAYGDIDPLAVVDSARPREVAMFSC